jgi:hypothetical protein
MQSGALGRRFCLSRCNLPRQMKETGWRVRNRIELGQDQRFGSLARGSTMFNFDLWMRINKAVLELERTKPADGKPFN